MTGRCKADISLAFLFVGMCSSKDVALTTDLEPGRTPNFYGAGPRCLPQAKLHYFSHYNCQWAAIVQT